MESNIYTLRLRSVNRDTFNAIKTGKKKVETRAATERYRNIKKGNTLKFVCGRSSFNKKVGRARIFRTVAALLKKYRPWEINPKNRTRSDSIKMYHSFPGYREKIKKYGLVAFELERN